MEPGPPGEAETAPASGHTLWLRARAARGGARGNGWAGDWMAPQSERFRGPCRTPTPSPPVVAPGLPPGTASERRGTGSENSLPVARASPWGTWRRVCEALGGSRQGQPWAAGGQRQVPVTANKWVTLLSMWVEAGGHTP